MKFCKIKVRLQPRQPCRGLLSHLAGGTPVTNPEIQKFLHTLNNHLNAANLNAFLLRRLHADNLDQDAILGLETALREANKLAKDFQSQVHAEAVPPTTPNPQ